MNHLLIFQKIGRFFFTKKRVWLFFPLLAAPFFLTLFLLLPRYLLLRETETTFNAAALRGRQAFDKRMEKEKFLSRYSNSEPYFIDQHLESLPLLTKNLNELKAIKSHPACKNREQVNRRIAFIEGVENRLSFAEENARSSTHIKETEERLVRAVEINVDDLSHLLSLIENVSVGPYNPDLRSPQLLIQDFVLTKKDRSTYELQMNLLKREFDYHDEKNK